MRIYPEVDLGKGSTDNALIVWLSNNTDDDLDGCSVRVVSMRRFDEEAKSFSARIETPSLTVVPAQALQSHKVTQPFVLASVIDGKSLRMEDAVRDANPFTIRERSIWRVYLRVHRTGNDYGHIDVLHFEWAPGMSPTFAIDPQQELSPHRQ